MAGAGQNGQRLIALLKNSDASIAALPPGTLVLAADLANPGVLEQDLDGYTDTVITAYSAPLGAALPDFFEEDDRHRTVWLPATGFLNQQWHDGPLVVTERGGLVSSYIPTGASAVLLLAPDRDEDGAEKKPIGRPKETALAIEGAAPLRLLRGATAAAQAATASISGPLYVAVADADVSSTPLEALVKLTLLRTALGGERPVTVCMPRAAKPSPQLRRLCENTGLVLSTWDQPDATLSQLFFWYDTAWTKPLFSAINAHGPVIPGASA